MHFKHCSSLLPLLLIFLSTSVAVSQSTDAVRWNLKQGEKLKVELQQDTGFKTNIGNRSQEVGNQMTMFVDWEVESAADDSFVIAQTITRIKLTVNIPDENGIQQTRLDTASDDQTGKLAEQLIEQINPLIGLKFQVTMSNRGEIKNVDIPKASLEAIRQAPSSMQIRQVITADGLRELIGQSAIVFPESSVAKGESWDSQTKVTNALGDFNKTNKFTFDGPQSIDAGEYQQFTVTTTVDEKMKEGAALKNFGGNGKIWFSADAPMILRSQTTNQMTSERRYRERIIESTVTTEIKMKVSRDNG